MLVFGAIALLSIVLNIDRIYQQNQLSFVEKQFSQLLAYGVFFFLVVATIRPEEVPAFTRLVMALACLTAVGVIYESRTGNNVFYVWSARCCGPTRDRRQSADGSLPEDDRRRAHAARARPGQHADDRAAICRAAIARSAPTERTAEVPGGDRTDLGR